MTDTTSTAVTWEGTDRLPPWLGGAVRSWEQAWAVDLTPLHIRFSRRMTRNFGYCRHSGGLVVVAHRLLGGDPWLLREVLCHELAHLAAARLHGPGVRPHGPQWRTLMLTAGFDPRRRLPPDPLAEPPPRRRRYLHRCRRCGATRETTRRMRQWRCVACRRAGHSGAVDILVAGWR